jgi:hypothetical protein
MIRVFPAIARVRAGRQDSLCKKSVAVDESGCGTPLIIPLSAIEHSFLMGRSGLRQNSTVCQQVALEKRSQAGSRNEQVNKSKKSKPDIKILLQW